MRAVLLTTLAAGTACAWNATGFRWRLPLSYEVNTQSSRELGRDATLGAVQASYDSWEAPACSGYVSRFAGETANSWRSGDGRNTLIWIYDRNQRPRELASPSTIGVTLSLSQGQQGVDGDILFNGIDHSWTTGNPGRGEVDAQSIITHETGHQLGLNHTPVQAATMYAAYLGGTGARSLHDDDIAGVCGLYPSDVAPECVEDVDCPGEQICRVGECADPGAVGEGAVGDPCGPQGECAAGNFCVGDQQTREYFCTRQCGAGCPQGWGCQRVRFQNGQAADICLPEEGEDPGAGNFGDPCEGGQDCASGICVGSQGGNDAVCSQLCAGDDCPAGAECVGLQGGGGACLPGAAPPSDPDMGVEPPPVDDPDAGVAPPPAGDADPGSGPPARDPDATRLAPGPGAGADVGAPVIIVPVGGSEEDASGGCSTGRAPAAGWALLLLAGVVRRRSSLPPTD